MRGKKYWRELAVLAILFFLYYLSPKTTPQKPRAIPSPTLVLTIATDSAKVIRVIDGDTIELETKQKVRYIGIDTPELHHPTKPVQCFAQQAYEENKKLVEGKIVILEKDISNTDKYGRLLRYVYLPPDQRETTHSGFFVNDYLVRQGFAFTLTYPPDVKYSDQFVRAQRDARESKRGLWKNCQTYK